MVPSVAEGDRQFKSSGSPGPRVVLLGASNLTRGFATVVSTAQIFLGQPLEVMAALGHGRSYGNWSSVLGRGLPGITDCGLWQALRGRPPAKTHALITDIGNDLLYQIPVPTIIGWVERCLDRLAEAEARTVLTLLPAVGIEGLHPFRYYLLRRIFFPRSQVSFEEAVGGTREINGRLRELAVSRAAAVVEPEAAWYGIDPIHVKFRHQREAWTTMLGAWRSADGPSHSGEQMNLRLNMLLLIPERRRILGIEQRRKQPCRKLTDGSTISLY